MVPETAEAPTPGAAAAKTRRPSVGTIGRAISRSNFGGGDDESIARSFREVFASFREVSGQKLPKKFSEMIVFMAAIDSVKKSSKSELSSRFFGRLKFSAVFRIFAIFA